MNIISLLVTLCLIIGISLAQTGTSSTAVATLSCVQPRKATDPSSTSISSVLTSAVPNACNIDLQKTSSDGLLSIVYYQLDSFTFNITHSKNAVNQQVVPNSFCPKMFSNIVNSCVHNASGAGYWGGWIISDGTNYSISNFEYPVNGLLPAPTSAIRSSTTQAGSGGHQPSYFSSITSASQSSGGTLPSGASQQPGKSGSSLSVPFPLASASQPFGGPVASDYSVSAQGLSSSRRVPGSAISSGSMSAQTLSSSSGRVPGVGIPSGSVSARSISLSSIHISSKANPTGGSLSMQTGPSAATLTPSRSRSSGFSSNSSGLSTGPSRTLGTQPGSPSSSSSISPSRTLGTQPGSLSSVSSINIPSVISAGRMYTIAPGLVVNGSPSDIMIGSASIVPGGAPYVQGSYTLALKTGGVLNFDGSTIQVAGGSVLPSAASTSASAPASTSASGSAHTSNSNPALSPSSNTITSTPVLTIPTTSIDATGAVASSDGVIIGGLLFGISKSGKSLSDHITIQASKTDFIKSIESVESQVEGLFKDMGGSLPPDSKGCSSSSRKRNIVGNLLGDVFNTLRCAINSLSKLKADINLPKPDFPTIDGDLGDIGNLAGDVNPNEKKTVDQKSSASTPQSASVSTSATSSGSVSGSTSSSSASSSSTDPCGASTGSGGGGLAKRTAGGSCNFGCPSPIPEAPTNGDFAITTGPTNDLRKRAVPTGRYNRFEKRKPERTIPKINNCVLVTPANLPVATPAYPGGFEFHQSDLNGVLGALSTVSRYYRSTEVGAAQCTPTITLIDAKSWTFSQSGAGVPENDKISVDHAYENNFLTYFMQSVIGVPTGISCADTNSIFFSTSGNCIENRMQDIFGSLASNDNPDFIAMSQWLNGNAKGWLLGPDFDINMGGALTNTNAVKPGDSWARAKDKLNRKLGLLKNLILGSLIINADNTLPLIMKTNKRIYQAFIDFDKYVASNPGLPRQNFDWAGQYKTYMDNFANYRNPIPALIPKFITNIQADLKIVQNNVKKVNQAEFQPLVTLTTTYDTTYNQANGAGSVQWSLSWDWSTGGSHRLGKRAGSCQRPQTTSGLSASSGLASASSSGAGVPTSLSSGASSTSSSARATVPPSSSLSSSRSATKITSAPSSGPSVTAPICRNNPVNQDPGNCIQPATSSKPFSCSAGSNLGLDTYDPATWCGCNTGTGTYPTMTVGTGNAACAYTALPTTIIHPTIVHPPSTSTPPVSSTPPPPPVSGGCMKDSDCPSGCTCAALGAMGPGVGACLCS